MDYPEFYYSSDDDTPVAYDDYKHTPYNDPSVVKTLWSAHFSRSPQRRNVEVTTAFEMKCSLHKFMNPSLSDLQVKSEIEKEVRAQTKKIVEKEPAENDREKADISLMSASETKESSKESKVAEKLDLTCQELFYKFEYFLQTHFISSSKANNWKKDKVSKNGRDNKQEQDETLNLCQKLKEKMRSPQTLFTEHIECVQDIKKSFTLKKEINETWTKEFSGKVKTDAHQQFHKKFNESFSFIKSGEVVIKRKKNKGKRKPPNETCQKILKEKISNAQKPFVKHEEDVLKATMKKKSKSTSEIAETLQEFVSKLQNGTENKCLKHKKGSVDRPNEKKELKHKDKDLDEVCNELLKKYLNIVQKPDGKALEKKQKPGKETANIPPIQISASKIKKQKNKINKNTKLMRSSSVVSNMYSDKTETKNKLDVSIHKHVAYVNPNETAHRTEPTICKGMGLDTEKNLLLQETTTLYNQYFDDFQSSIKIGSSSKQTISQKRGVNGDEHFRPTASESKQTISQKREVNGDEHFTASESSPKRLRKTKTKCSIHIDESKKPPVILSKVHKPENKVDKYSTLTKVKKVPVSLHKNLQRVVKAAHFDIGETKPTADFHKEDPENVLTSKNQTSSKRITTVFIKEKHYTLHNLVRRLKQQLGSDPEVTRTANSERMERE